MNPPTADKTWLLVIGHLYCRLLYTFVLRSLRTVDQGLEGKASKWSQSLLGRHRLYRALQVLRELEYWTLELVGRDPAWFLVCVRLVLNTSSCVRRPQGVGMATGE